MIIQDEADTVGFIRKGLKEEGYLVTCCNETEEGFRFAVRKQWDIIIVDRVLPGNIDGLSIVNLLRKLDNKTPVLILTPLKMLNERVRRLRAIGNDYLIKPFNFFQLLARVENLTQRNLPLQDREELQVEDLKLNFRTRRAERAGKPISLQPREFRLLEYLVRHQNQIVTRTMLIESVWDSQFDSSDRVLNVQISRLRKKIDRGFSPSLLHTIRGAGYMVRAKRH